MPSVTGKSELRCSTRPVPRSAGRSKWTTSRKIRLMIDSFVEFAPVPFLMTTVAGLGLAGLGLLGACVAALAGLGGWVFVLAAVFFVGGLQLAALGGFGEYLWRAGDDARQRPLYVLRGVRDWGTPGQVTAWEPIDENVRSAPARP